MLRIDHERAPSREAEPGANRSFLKSQRGDPVQRRDTRAGLSLDRAASAPAAVPAARPESARLAAPLLGEDDGPEPGAGDAADRPLSGQRHSTSGQLPAAPLCTALHAADIELLAAVDEAHDILSGPATRRILQREYQHYDKLEYQRLATISVAHLYNLRRQQRYRERRLTYHKTKPTTVSIGERRRPDPQGRPGYLRVDTVHQGDQNSAKGVYHINAVDEVTQWQIVAATERISEACLEPVLVALLRQFPFRIRGFHSDNGSEFVNHIVARLLNKLLIEQTKSRPRHSNDNGLVETKNGAVIRKHMGYGYIAGEHALAIHGFYAQHLNPHFSPHG